MGNFNIKNKHIVLAALAVAPALHFWLGDSILEEGWPFFAILAATAVGGWIFNNNFIDKKEIKKKPTTNFGPQKSMYPPEPQYKPGPDGTPEMVNPGQQHQDDLFKDKE